MATSLPPSSVESSAGATGPVERAFAVLQAVVAAGEAVGVRELGRRTGLPRSTTSRLLNQLCNLGMVERTAEGAFGPGSALATLAVSGDSAPLFRDRLRPLLAGLADQYGESVALAVDDGDSVLYVAQMDANSAVKAPDVVDERHPFHVVAHGLVIMAWWDDDRLDRYLSAPLAAATTASMSDPDEVRARLEQIRSDFYVWTTEEFDNEVNGVAVPVFEDGRVLGSLGLYGPSYRLSLDRYPTLAEDLVELVSNFEARRS